MKNQLALYFVFISLLFPGVCQAQQEEYDQLKAKIEAERGEPHDDDGVSKDIEEYIHWLGIKAADRDRAQELAAATSNAGNPYWEERFLDLIELAHDSGETTLWMADYLFLRIKTKTGGIRGDNWQGAVFKADHYGKRLYLRAQELGFDAEYIRESVRCLMRFSLGNVETGDICLYHNRVLRHGTQFDSEGNLIQPDMDFDINCLPRSAFHVESEGTQGVSVDEGLSNVDQIRDICEWFQLFEYNEGTDLMNQFLQDFLCDDKHNPDKELQWYLALAQKYKLKKSEEHILGFYGKVYGKVEIQEGKQYKDASGAKVQITDKPNTLKTTANDKGNYEIEKAPLHCKCSPYPISAEYEGARVDSKYEGHLDKPMPDSRQKKDLLIPGTTYTWNGSLNLEVTRRFQCNEEEKTSQSSSRRIIANDEHTQRANVTIGMDDFDLTQQPAIPGTHLIRDASGEMNCMISEDHLWISPDSHVTLSGQASRTIKKENINLLIVKDIELNKDAMQNLQQQMMEAAQNGDMAAVQTLKGQMGMVQGDQNNNVIPIRIIIEIVFDITKKDLITRTSDGGSNTIELSIAIPIAVKMKGTYTQGKDGSGTIKASVDMTETSPGMFRSMNCPDATTTISGQINLERKRK